MNIAKYFVNSMTCLEMFIDMAKLVSIRPIWTLQCSSQSNFTFFNYHQHLLTSRTLFAKIESYGLQLWKPEALDQWSETTPMHCFTSLWAVAKSKSPLSSSSQLWFKSDQNNHQYEIQPHLKVICRCVSVLSKTASLQRWTFKNVSSNKVLSFKKREKGLVWNSPLKKGRGPLL